MLSKTLPPWLWAQTILVIALLCTSSLYAKKDKDDWGDDEDADDEFWKKDGEPDVRALVHLPLLNLSTLENLHRSYLLY